MQHLGRMVDDLLDVSRITRGKIEVSPRRIELSQAVHQAVEPRRRIAAASRMNLVVEEAPAPLWIDGDPTRVEQVIVNLVDNAIKYGVPGGTVTVSLELQDNQAELAVKDDGRGMTDEQLRDAFELFVQHALDGLDRPRG
ncbi:MAG TPA: hybrid sensor histidine kinase/response regulator, partial [Myxococcales bacterium]|nr:hybrid sensor histidine kinase/response regulator [Myxococcales bacterium]